MEPAGNFEYTTPSVRLPELESIFCGFIIDEQGRECAITETMIHDACQALEQAAITGLHAHPPR